MEVATSAISVPAGATVSFFMPPGSNPRRATEPNFFAATIFGMPLSLGK